MPGRSPSDHVRSNHSSQSHHYSQGQDSDHPMNRHASNRSSNPNVFSDDYSLEHIDSEQTTLTPSSQSVSSFTSSSTLRSVPVHHKPANTPTSEHEPVENPFGDEARVSFDEAPYRSSLPPKGIDTVNRNSIGSTNTTPSSIAQRSQSNSSRFSVPPRALSPYTGATGPSHPYAMYPQVGVSRSPSITTTSTMRPSDRPLGDSNAPQHPYAMYPQNVVPEEGMDDGTIPLGFPGHNQAYERPPGRADDDVGDLVGPDGHTEQLPPYTRYPDGVVPKEEGSFEAATDAGVIGEENQPDRQEDVPDREDTPRPLAAARPAPPPPAPHSEPPEDPPTGVMAFEEKLKTTGKKKACCGLPIWTLVLVCVVILVVACIGGIIGGVLGTRKAASDENQKKQQGSSDPPTIVTVTATPQMDATPITTIPPHMSALPTGNYVIPASPKNMSRFCVADSDYKASWSCLNKGTLPINVQSIDRLHGSISFQSDPYSGAGTYTYGAQQPYLPVPTQSMNLVHDTSDMSLGPALFFMTSFDKLVVVPGDVFPENAGVSKRGISEDDILPRASSQRRSIASVGDQPWFCWWNSTIMEFFLYVNETTNEALHGSTTLSSDASPTSYNPAQASASSYPRRIKMEERRDYPDTRSPYCQQMSVLSDGSVTSISPNTINIKQVEPTPTTTLKGSAAASTQTYTAMAEYQSTCYCVSLTD